MYRLTLLSLFTILLVSCDPEMHKFPHERETAAPTEVLRALPPYTPSVRPTPIQRPSSVQNADLTDVFLTPQQDRNLPSKEQLSEDAASSIGINNPRAVVPGTQPSTAIKPPSSTPSLNEDDLAPSE